jgi:branched-chain amino acid transport system permease protein
MRVALAGVLLLAALTLPLVAGEGYVLHLIINGLIFTMLASSLNLMLGYAGLVSIAHAAFFGIGAYSSALLTLRAGIPFWCALVAATAIAALVAVALGIPSFRTRGIYYIIVTIAFQLIATEAFDNWDTVTGGGLGLKDVPRPNGFETKRAYYYLVLVVAVAAQYALVRLVRSPVGRALIALRDNETKAGMMGVEALWYKTVVLAVGAGVAGLAGSLYVHYLQFAHPEFFTFAVSIDIFLAVMLGGAGTLFGPVLGVAMIETMRELLHAFAALRLLIFSVLLVVLIIFRPHGLLPALVAGARRLMPRAAAGAHAREETG